MIPAILMYTYYGKVVGDVAALAAGVSPPRGVEYYVLLAVGLVAIAVSTTMITRGGRREMERHRQTSVVTRAAATRPGRASRGDQRSRWRTETRWPGSCRDAAGGALP